MPANVRLGTGDLGLRMQTAEFRRGAARAANEIRRVQRQARALAGQVRRTNAAFTAFNANVLNLRRAFTLLIGGGVIGAAIKRTAEMGANIQEAADRAGIASDRFNILSKVFESDGVSTERFGRAVGRLAFAMREAQAGVATYADIFNALGVNVTNSNGDLRDIEDILRELSIAFPRVENRMDRLGIATELFGNRNAAMLNTFQRGPEVFEATILQMEQLGIVTSEQFQNLKDLDQSFRDLSTRISNTFFVALSESSKELEELNSIIGRGIAVSLPSVVRGIGAVADNIETLRTALTALIALKVVITLNAWVASFATFRAAVIALTTSLRALVIVGGPIFLLTSALTLTLKLWDDSARGARRYQDAIDGLASSVETLRLAELRRQESPQESFRREVAAGSPGLTTGAGYAGFADRIIRDTNNAARGLGLDPGPDTTIDERARIARERRNEQAAELERIGRRRREEEEKITGELTKQADINTEIVSGDSTGETNEDKLKREREAQEELIETERRRLALINQIASTTTDGILEFIEGTKSLKDAFADTARSIIRDLVRIQIQQQIAGFLGAVFPGAGAAAAVAPSIIGGGRGGGRPPGFQQGGYVGSTRRVRVGESGPEEVLVPARSRVASTRRQPASPIVYNFNIASTDGPGVQAALAQAAPVIVQQSLAAFDERSNQRSVF